MSKICYVSKRFAATSLSVIETANGIIDDYSARGFSLTLRQLYYQFVARDVFPQSWFDERLNTFNTQKNYKKLGNVINDGRLAGEIDWLSIEDRTRNVKKVSVWNSTADILESCARQFKFDKWKDQETRVEVWIEKDALIGVIEDVCNEHEVPHFSCRGYNSQSEMWRAANRLAHYYDACGQSAVVIHLGDHDPSGIDMTRDIQDRFNKFANGKIYVERIALNRDQIDTYNPPPNYAKVTDSRCKAYILDYGEDSWELDALEPEVMVDLVSDTIEKYKNKDAWQQGVDAENIEKEKLQNVADNWE